MFPSGSTITGLAWVYCHYVSTHRELWGYFAVWPKSTRKRAVAARRIWGHVRVGIRTTLEWGVLTADPDRVQRSSPWHYSIYTADSQSVTLNTWTGVAGWTKVPSVAARYLVTCIPGGCLHRFITFLTTLFQMWICLLNYFSSAQILTASSCVYVYYAVSKASSCSVIKHHAVNTYGGVEV
jgi:hypothetical protein